MRQTETISQMSLVLELQQAEDSAGPATSEDYDGVFAGMICRTGTTQTEPRRLPVSFELPWC